MPAFDTEQVQKVLDKIDTSNEVGLRDRGLLGTLAYTFARIGVVVNLKVLVCYPQPSTCFRTKTSCARPIPFSSSSLSFLSDPSLLSLSLFGIIDLSFEAAP